MTYYTHPGTVNGNDVRDGSVALGLVQAVAAGLVKSTKGLGIETGNVELATQGVILEDFVGCVSGSATDDAELGVEALACQGIFADVFPPN
jgi:hypothetical protein